ncbi:hypothetical protein JW949_02445 [Candidatus Woesearchaeota archaeon]|nr:hypothetical protein [Candidatus Woesearchaeota archaeon]
MMKNTDSNDYVKLAGTLCGIFLTLAIIMAIFAKESLVFVLTNTVWAFVVLGVILGAFMSKTSRINKKK